MNGLMTAREVRLPIVVVVLNNQAPGWVKHGQRDRPIACDFLAFDHAAIAPPWAVVAFAWRSPTGSVPRSIRHWRPTSQQLSMCGHP
jgi:thiamine pyrophosphate-dependent acetolactate synthase large subunit-like protein